MRTLEDNCVNKNSLENRRELNAKLNYKVPQDPGEYSEKKGKS